MFVTDLIHQIKQNEEYWGGRDLTPSQIRILANCSRDEYDLVVSSLLAEPVIDNEELRGRKFRQTYAHLVYGCTLSVLRPNPNLYSVVLNGALGIDDPSSSQVGVLALRQLKPLENVVNDLRKIAGKNTIEQKILRHIAWLLYWFGFSENGRWNEKTLTYALPDEFEPLVNETDIEPVDLDEIEKMTAWASEIMRLHYSSIGSDDGF